VAEIGDSTAFGDFLSRAKARVGKTSEQLNKELGVSCVAWHTFNSFPTKNRLPKIAQVYSVDLDELTAVYERAKAGRLEERRCRRGSSRSRVSLANAANYDPPAFGRAAGRTHSYRNSGGR
jgi:hypothetical protein